MITPDGNDFASNSFIIPEIGVLTVLWGTADTVLNTWGRHDNWEKNQTNNQIINKLSFGGKVWRFCTKWDTSNPSNLFWEADVSAFRHSTFFNVPNWQYFALVS